MNRRFIVERESLSPKSDFIIVFTPFEEAETTGARTLPYGPLFLAESLQNHGYSVAILDGPLDVIINRLRESLGSETVAVGISTMSGIQLKNSLQIAAFIRTNFPSVPIIWGGAHVNSLPKQTLEHELVDYICWGEAELSLPMLLDAIRNKGDLSQIKGIGFSRNGKYVLTEQPDYTPLDRMFKLPYNLLNVEPYVRKLKIGVDRCLSIWTSRGCPYSCHFCSNSCSVWPNTKMRYFSIENVIDNIKTLVRDYQVDGLIIEDDIFFLNERRVREICYAILDANFKLKFRGASRIDVLDRLSDETWELVLKAGFIAIATGVESGSQRIRDYINKRFTLSQIYSVDKKLTNYGLYKTYFFMTCVPTETVEDVRETMRLIVSLAKTSKYCPYPFGTMHNYIPLGGTELFERSKEFGFVEPQRMDEWANFTAYATYESCKSVRPWLTREMWEYVNTANEHIMHLNELFVGKDSNESEIDSYLDMLHSIY